MESERKCKVYFAKIKRVCFDNDVVNEDNLLPVMLYLDLTFDKIFTPHSNMSYTNVVLLHRWILHHDMDVKLDEWLVMKAIDYCRANMKKPEMREIFLFLSIYFERLTEGSQK